MPASSPLGLGSAACRCFSKRASQGLARVQPDQRPGQRGGDQPGAVFHPANIQTQPTDRLGVLRERNFGLSSISSVGLGMGLYGSIYVLFCTWRRFRGYNALQIGEVIMWMGVPQLFLIPFVPLMMKKISPKWLCAIGFGLFGGASFPPAYSIRILPASSSITSRSSAHLASPW